MAGGSLVDGAALDLRAFAAELPKRPLAVSQRPVAALDAQGYAAAEAEIARKAKGQQSINTSMSFRVSNIPFKQGSGRKEAVRVAHTVAK